MHTKLCSVASLVAIASAVAIPPEVLAQDLPNSALANYASFRLALLKNGWKPDSHYGIKMNNGDPMYRYVEVICGNSLCTAQWIARNGRKFNITLWRDDAGEYRVAPQIDWIEAK